MNPFEHYLASVNRDWMFDDDNPPTFGLLYNCIMYARDTGNTLPKEVLDDLVDLMELLRSGRDVEVFKKHGTKPTVSPLAAVTERAAVAYVEAAKEGGWDEHPIKTICDAFGIERSAYYCWKKKYGVRRVDYSANQWDIFLRLGPDMRRFF